MNLSFFKSSNIAAISLTTLLLAPVSRAAVTITFDEVGGDVVVASSGGSMFTSSMSVGNTTTNPINPSIGYVVFRGTGSLFSNVTFIAPTGYGSGGLAAATSSSGATYGIVPTISRIQVPSGYVSGSLLPDAQMTFANQSFASLGITPGVYEYRYVTDAQSGSKTDTVTLRIGQSSNVPDGGTSVALLSFSLLGLAGLRKKLNR